MFGGSAIDYGTAEIAERFMYLEGMRWSLAFAEYEDQLYFSVRTGDRL